MKQDVDKLSGFENKTVLVTGSSRGIGKEISIGFAKAGANIVLCSKSNVALLKETENEILSLGASTLSSIIDVTDISSVEHVVEESVKKFGNIDVLVNNAGNFINSVVRKMDKKIWDDVIDVNLNGVFNCTKVILSKTSADRIINITSVQGQTGVIGAANYAAAKAGVVGFTKSVAKEVARKNITVNAVSLGFINTGMLKRLPESMQIGILNQIPMGRFGYPNEVSDLVMFLASEKAAYITGQTVNLNGGYYM
jgi:3-oxoacyl-[acyl-carrier protein] reductase